MTDSLAGSTDAAYEVQRDPRGMVWAAVVENVHLYHVGVLQDELTRLKAGADWTLPAEFCEMSPAQLWAWLLRQDPAQRLERLRWLLADAVRGLTCWRMDHERELAAHREGREYDRAEAAIREEATRGRHIR